MSEKKYKTLNEFYPYYLTEHQNYTCRVLHFIGTGLVIISFLKFLVSMDWIFLAIIPLIGYGFAWVGHFFFEKNKPATFQYPGNSLACDFKLFWDLLCRKEKFKA